MGAEINGLMGGLGLYGPDQALGYPGDKNFYKLLARTAISAVGGGTAAALGGGKFASGAYTAAMQHLFSAEVPDGAVKMGWRWLTGADTGETSSYNIRSGHTMADELIEMPHVKSAIDQAALNADSGKFQPVAFFRDLGTVNPARYLGNFLLDIVYRNRTQALHGSIRGTARVVRIVGNTKFIQVLAVDTLGLESMTREPPKLTQALSLGYLGAGKTYSTNYMIKNNTFGDRSMGSNVNVNYNVYTTR